MILLWVLLFNHFTMITYCYNGFNLEISYHQKGNSMSNIKKWTCTVCGYVIESDHTPDSCPVCGAGAEYFKEEESENGDENLSDIEGWRCLICGFESRERPDECPVCAASKDQFIALYKKKQTNNNDTIDMDNTIIIIGSGIAALSAAQSIKEQESRSRVIMLSMDKIVPYYRLNLTRYLAGEISKELLDIKKFEWFVKKRIELRLNSEVVGLDLVNKRVILKNNENISYKKLILATGAHPFSPPFKNNKKDNVSVVRTVEDVDMLLEKCGKQKKFVIIGGGILGLETAGALALRGEEILLLEGFSWLLPRQLNRVAGNLLQSIAEEKGIRFRKEIKVTEFQGDQSANGVLLNTGEVIKADYFIITTGVRSNTWLAREAGINVDRGILVDDMMMTSIADIYAAGDVCQHRGIQYGTWAPAQYQGVIAGINASGGTARFEGIPRTNLLKVLDVEMFSQGEVNITDGSYKKIEYNKNGNYYLFAFKDEMLTGSILLGDSSISSNVTNVLEKRINCSAILKNDLTLNEVVDFFKKY